MWLKLGAQRARWRVRRAQVEAGSHKVDFKCAFNVTFCLLIEARHVSE